MREEVPNEKASGGMTKWKSDRKRSKQKYDDMDNEEENKERDVKDREEQEDFRTQKTS